MPGARGSLLYGLLHLVHYLRRHHHHHHLLLAVQFSSTLLDTQFTSGGKIHITLGGWTAANGVPCLGITAHWLEPDFATMHDILLDFVRLHGPHTATHLAYALMTTLQHYGIQ